jgi:two-component system, NtrC family, sensor kinase
MRDSLWKRLGAVALALLTLTAIVFGVLNFRQRQQFITPDDGVTWFDTEAGVRAQYIAADSPAAQAGLKTGDLVLAINDVRMSSATQVTRRLWHLGVWMEADYKIRRAGEVIDVRLITAPAEKPASMENFLRVVGLLYLFIGLFIFARRWSAARAVHFYIFCLASFILYFYHYSGKLNAFDWTIYWSNEVALLLQPALFLHFALVFPGRRGPLWPKLAAVYAVPAALLALHIGVATQTLDLLPSIGNRHILDQRELAYLGLYFLLAAFVFLRSYRRTPSGILRQQLKWVTAGTLAGILPFLLFYILPYALGLAPRRWMDASALSLALLPLCFAYAIIRYRLMDVDIIFKRGLAYTFATAAVVGIYFALVAGIGEMFHTAWPSGPGGGIIAIVVAAFLFQPVRDWVQARLDHFFYRDRLDYRRTLMEFGRALTNEVRIDPLLSSVLDRVSQTFLVDHLALFVEDDAQPDRFMLARSMGIRPTGQLDLSFLDPARLAPGQNCFFFDSGRTARDQSESVRHSIDELALNYYVACRFREHTVAFFGLGRTVDGDFLTTDDLDLLNTIGSYVAIALENARLYHSLEQKAVQIERLKDFSENIVSSLNIGVLSADLEDHIESWNPQLERMLAISAGEAMSKPLADVLPAELSAEIAARLQEERVSGIYRLRLLNRAGSQVVVNVSIAPLLGKSGERIGRILLLDDVTQRVRMEDQLIQTEKLTSLGLLAAGVAHEVNTPLAVISNYIQMLAKQIPENDPKQKTIEKIVKQTFRASEIVNNLLNFSRTGGAEWKEIDLNALLEETLSLVQHPFKTANVSVIRSFTPELPSVLGSNNRLQQVFLNLFLNARDAMPGGGMLEVRTSVNHETVEVEVTDTGVGIAAENVARIFDPFFTTKASGRGTGLGLSVSYGILKEHAGRIDVRSTPGKGTSFRLELPATRKVVHA